VVRVVNYFRANETVYMVMAYESGHTLQEHIARIAAKGSRPSEQFVRKAFIGLCSGLREVHANMLLHLDLKPANIYLRTDGSPLLLDFGAARQTIKLDAPMLAPMYTPGFAAPDLYTKGAALGPWTDIYSLGASMYACMACATPQPSDQRKLEDKLAPKFEELKTRYSSELVDMVRACLELDPMARPQSVFAIQKLLQAAPAAAAPELDADAAEQEGAGGWRGLVGRLGGLARGKARSQE
jgi:serine/threonine protein kinase